MPHATKGTCGCALVVLIIVSDVLAWLGLEASGFGLALGGFGFQNLQAKPSALALAWLWLGLA